MAMAIFGPIIGSALGGWIFYLNISIGGVAVIMASVFLFDRLSRRCAEAAKVSAYY
jgi:hypothetical protein